MRIKQIKAINFRTLKNLQIDLSQRYCTISGHNNAGKSSVIRIIGIIFGESNQRPWMLSDIDLSYDDDKTKWLKDDEPIFISSKVELSAADDSALISYMSRLLSKNFEEETIELEIQIEMDSRRDKNTKVFVNSEEIEKFKSRDIIQRMRAIENLFLHNSTTAQRDQVYRAGRPIYAYELHISPRDHQSIMEADTKLRREFRKTAKAHTSELNEMLQRLSGKIGVELSVETGTSRRVPMSVNLTDKNVEVSILDWGSGTQNRTKILMSLLQAHRLKRMDDQDSKTTPVIVVEEPESFLHPSAQAEFGHILQLLSEEMDIQIIVATHSPYMLNQAAPDANILLKRRISRSKNLETYIVDTSGDDWKVPYAEHLGIVPPEFDSWRDIITSKNNKVLMVEGEIDKSYFDYLRKEYPSLFPLPEDVEIVPYGGKDALKNTTILKFIINRMDEVFVTFDLDAAHEAKIAVSRLGLEEGKDFLAIGIDKPGKQAIEGLLPDRILSRVYGREVDLVMASQSANSTDRKSAKNKIKQILLDEFKSSGPYEPAEIKSLSTIAKTIAKKFSKAALQSVSTLEKIEAIVDI